MKTQYIYILLNLPTLRCWQIGDRERVEVSLPALLADGWRPVRETADSAPGVMLLVLERDGGGSSSFGFGPP